MITIIQKITDSNYNETLQTAADIIKTGGLVAFPTETVYGLGANAFDKNAINRIYKAKGRPSDNPLIVHIGDLSGLNELIAYKNDYADKLIKAFWPGPLTLIFKKSDLIPNETSGGLDTVAIRYPQNKIAQDFIKTCNVPIAAPSANTSGKPSPTRSSHVQFDLDKKIDMIIDGGHSQFGLESTIVDVSTEVPCILRPGSITKEMLEQVIGTIQMPTTKPNEPPKAPGMKYTHYSPIANVTIVTGQLVNIIDEINSLAKIKLQQGYKVGILATNQTKHLYDTSIYTVLVVGDRDKPDTISANLYKMLRKFDYNDIDYVYAEGFDEIEIGLAIMNRLKKAAGFNIIKK